MIGGEPSRAGRQIELSFVPAFGEASLAPGQLVETRLFRQTISVTRLDFLVSEVELREAGGGWVSLPGQVFYLSHGERRLGALITKVPGGVFDRIRFRVGLNPEVNASPPAQYPAGHPLNPETNGLHWGWQGGYVFMALEGLWRTGSGDLSGWSFHLATDRIALKVELPVAIPSGASRRIEVGLDMAKVLDAEFPVRFTTASASTHSREGDEFAARLARQVVASFSVVGSEAMKPGSDGGEAERSATIAAGATPYRYRTSRAFPFPNLPRDNPLTEEGVELGRRLFLDPLLSVNGKQACVSCHQPDAGFVDRGKAVSLGAQGQVGTRNAMPLFNLAWKRRFFWDGRAATLREQVLMPIENPVEMNEKIPNVLAKLRTHEDYPDRFVKAFGPKGVTRDTLARALEQYLLTLVSYDSKFDRMIHGSDEFTPQEKRGYALFFTEHDPRRGLYGADCFHCHGGPMFTNDRYQSNGLDKWSKDPGLYAVTEDLQDWGRFSVPSLRNIELTAPYMHDGRFASLEEVIEHYNSGVKLSPVLDPNLAKHPASGLNLSEEDKAALLAFLRTLTDERYRPAERQVAEK